MKSSQAKQYTVRSLSPQLDRALRQKSRETGKSLNEVVLETLEKGAGLGEQPIEYRDLDALIGTWKEDQEFDAALRAQDQIDPHLWS
ncbi:MAG: hypothetical protein HYV03_06620 [Deltaproteobacteria bacterium]|nr:hypothetical protein [Deltaproteobacteria bacterium]